MRALTVALLVTGIHSLYADVIPKPAPSPVESKIDWVYDYTEGKKLSKESGRPMFVVFRCER